MNLLKDMELFVRIVHSNGLAAAGRELGMTAPNVTMRIKNLEKHYQVKLLSRTTRRINLTDEGRDFYTQCVKILDNISQIENQLRSVKKELTGSLRISATSDLGRQHIAQVIKLFNKDHPRVVIHLNVTDSVKNLIEDNLSLAIRYGVSSDSHLIAHKLAASYRVLCASPQYLEKFGTPKDYLDLKQHACLTMVQIKTPLSSWYFQTPHGEKQLNIQATRSCDDGALIRQWALDGVGIALKSIWDVQDDIAKGRLVTLLDEFKPNYQSKKVAVNPDLFVVYRDRKYLPKRNRIFIEYLKEYFSILTAHSKLD